VHMLQVIGMYILFIHINAFIAIGYFLLTNFYIFVVAAAVYYMIKCDVRDLNMAAPPTRRRM